MDINDRMELAHRGQEEDLVRELERRGTLAQGVFSIARGNGRLRIALRTPPGNHFEAVERLVCRLDDDRGG